MQSFQLSAPTLSEHPLGADTSCPSYLRLRGAASRRDRRKWRSQKFLKCEGAAGGYAAVSETGGPVDQESWGCEQTKTTAHGAEIVERFRRGDNPLIELSGKGWSEMDQRTRDRGTVGAGYALEIRFNTSDPAAELHVVAGLASADEAAISGPRLVVAAFASAAGCLTD
jgi:hypothetical protein